MGVGSQKSVLTVGQLRARLASCNDDDIVIICDNGTYYAVDSSDAGPDSFDGEEVNYADGSYDEEYGGNAFVLEIWS